MPKPAQFWLVKTEPSSYGWTQFVADRRTAWTGVRNFTARNNLRAMRKGERVLFYHSVVGKEIVGIAEVAAEAYRDPTATEGEWEAVDLVPRKPLPRAVTLTEIKATPALRGIALLKQSRLSVVPITAAEFDEILRLASSPA